MKLEHKENRRYNKSKSNISLESKRLSFVIHYTLPFCFVFRSSSKIRSNTRMQDTRINVQNGAKENLIQYETRVPQLDQKATKNYCIN